MLRFRDFAAALALVYLTTSVWDDQQSDSSVSAEFKLAFYHENWGISDLVDVDGDGSPEALGIWKEESSSWKLVLLDLRNSLKRKTTSYRPKIFLTSDEVPGGAVTLQALDDDDNTIPLRPLRITTGQVLSSNRKHSESEKQTTTDDRTLNYFCGHDWHDAATRCESPCPSGQSSDCPDDQKCFADSGCHEKTEKKPAMETDKLRTTPGGGWPSLFTVWSQGIVSMHSLTAETDSQLELKQMWRVHPFAMEGNPVQVVDWEDVAVVFVDALSSSTPAGSVIISGTAVLLEDAEDSELESSSFAIALDALTGKRLWVSSASDLLDRAVSETPEIPLPVVVTQGRSSSARRRSLVPGLLHTTTASGHHSGKSNVNCMKEYRRSVLVSGALPYQHWGADDDTKIMALHFDHQKAKESKPRQKHHAKKQGLFSRLLHGKAHHKKHLLQYGRPNVVVTHDYNGIHVRSLKNGRSLCHMNLQFQTLYADINYDGTLDSVRVITGGSRSAFSIHQDDDESKEEMEWIESFARRVEPNAGKTTALGNILQKLGKSSQLCHILALSGLPTKRELFSAPLSTLDGEHGDMIVEGAPPLAVESSSPDSPKGHDIVTAVNTGGVDRIRGHNGRRVWSLNGREEYPNAFPTWEDPSLVALQRIDSKRLVPETRPILLVGENSAALLAASSGRIHSILPFAQSTTARPRLMDLNSDGTTDFLVYTKDAIWGYHISVHTGTSALSRIVVGLLILGLMLAMIRNRFGPHPGKRSTDL